MCHMLKKQYEEDKLTFVGWSTGPPALYMLVIMSQVPEHLPSS